MWTNTRRTFAAGKHAAEQPIPRVQYDYVKKISDSEAVKIVDVREPDELQTNGKIPGTINIPRKIALPWSMNALIGWLSDSSIDWLIDWLSDSSIDWLIDWTCFLFVVDQVAEAFALPPKDLSRRYRLDIESYNDEVIFHCRSGKRSESACLIARDAGYKK